MFEEYAKPYRRRSPSVRLESCHAGARYPRGARPVAGTKNVEWISAARRRSRIFGSASTGPKRPWESATGSVTPRAIQRVSASRSKVKAHAARAPSGQPWAVIRSGSGGLGRLRGRTAPRHRDAEREPAVDLVPADQPAADRRVRRGPAGDAGAARGGPAREPPDERGLVRDAAALGVVVRRSE